MRPGGRGPDDAGTGQLALPSAAMWLGEPLRYALDAGRLKAGLNAIEVDCAAPCYATAHISPVDLAMPRVVAPLEVAGPNSYRAMVSLTGGAREAWLELLPGDAAVFRSVRIGRVPWAALAGQAWRAVVRHVRAPMTLLAKVRQVAGGHGNLVLASGRGGHDDAGVSYQRWQTAFESAAQHDRLLGLADCHLGPGLIDVLAVVGPEMDDAPAVEALLASLRAAYRARVRVFDLRTETVAQLAALHDASPATLVLCLDTAGRFHPMAVVCLALALATTPGAIAAYGDDDVLDAGGGRRSPRFKPAWSPDFQAATDYVGQPIACRPLPAVLAALGAEGSTSRLSSRLLERLSAPVIADGAIVHVPRVLFHGQSARPAMAAVVSPPLGDSLVSVIIPTRDNADLLARAWRSVREARGVRTELVIVDNGARTAAQTSLLAQLAAAGAARIVRDHGAFNFSRLINAGRAEARGDVLVLLNDDVEAIERDWLAELARAALRPGVGAVGALLLYPDGRVQHAGVLLGINGGAGHAFRFADAEGPYADPRLAVPREVSAVTGACLAVRARLFDDAGGFAEDLPVTLNDVDFCMKLRALGHRNLFWPAARLIHRESTTRGLDATPEKLTRLARETAAFQRKWGAAALADPYPGPHASPAHDDLRPRRL